MEKSYRKKYIDFKDGVNNLDLLYMHPALMMILAYINMFCHEHDITFQLTSIHRTEAENKAVKAVSRTHIEWRAFDFSLRSEHGWNYELIQKLVNEINAEFSHLGAISSKTKQSRPIVVHKNHTGHGIHAHVQIRRNIKKL